MIEVGDMRKVLRSIKSNTFDACVTDAPYEIKILGSGWDATGVAFDPDAWRALYRVMKPGAFLLNFTAARTYHRIATAIEQAGFQIVTQIAWIYGSGMPAGGKVGVKIDAMLGKERPVVGSRVLSGNAAMTTKEKGGTYSVGADSRGRKKKVPITAPGSPQAARWEEFGFSIKPGLEPIVVARKPPEGGITRNVLKHGTGVFNVGACKLPVEGQPNQWRWPPNVAFSHAPECARRLCAPWCPVALLEAQTGLRPSAGNKRATTGVGAFHGSSGRRVWMPEEVSKGDTGTAARYFPQFKYWKKASTKEKTFNGLVEPHKTTKPYGFLKWLTQLVTRGPGAWVVDPFCGSGTTGLACVTLDLKFYGVELREEAARNARKRIKILKRRKARKTG